MISVVAATELFTLGRSAPRTQKEFDRLYRWLLQLDNLVIVDITLAMAILAAQLRQKYGFKTPDALHLACAIASHAVVFVTSDRKLKQCREIMVEVLRSKKRPKPTNL